MGSGPSSRARCDVHAMTGKDYDDDFSEIRIDRQDAQALAGGGEDRICHCSTDNGCRSFTNATWSFCVLNQVRLHHRHLVDTHRQIAVEIALLDASILEGDSQDTDDPHDTVPCVGEPVAFELSQVLFPVVSVCGLRAPRTVNRVATTASPPYPSTICGSENALESWP